MKSCVTNLQRTVPVNVPLLEENVVRVKRALGISKFKLNVWLRSDKMVQRMNKIDRNIDKPTDVLSYSYQIIAPGTLPKYSKDTKELGEIVFGMGYIQEYCQKTGKDIDKELERLTVHGMCHILGYDHEVDSDYAVMHSREMEVMKKLKQMKKEEKEDKQRTALYSPFSETLTTSDAETALLDAAIEDKKVEKKLTKKPKRSTSAKVAKKPRKKKKDESSSSSSSDGTSSSSSLSSSSS